MKSLRPNNQRAKIAIIFIWLVLGVKMLDLVSEIVHYFQLQSASMGKVASDQQTFAFDMIEGLIGLLYLGVFVGSIVTFIQWFRRAYYNLGLLSNRLSTTDGWAAAIWFIPIISLYRPYQMMKEMFREADNVLNNKLEDYTPLSSTKTVGVWWTFWIISNLLGNVVFRLEVNAVTIERMMTASLCQMLLGLLYIPLSLIAVRVIKEYAEMEVELVKLQPINSGDPLSDISDTPMF